MGANNSTRRVSFESDQNDNITVVKGIRLSENVINRMREPSAPPKRTAAPASLFTPSTCGFYPKSRTTSNTNTTTTSHRGSC
uniref:Uncharacterized protein n=1 Tax=Periophthalmus magnuspinnatus TaxID=409849 RepID=A0A3B3ZG38_9GOBI